MTWRAWLLLFRVAVAVVLGVLGNACLDRGDSATAIWAFTLGGFIIFHAVIWDPFTDWLGKSGGEETLQKTWIETIRTMMGWLFATSSIIIGFIVTKPQLSTQPGALDEVALVSKVGVVALAAGICFGVFYITTLVTSLQDRNGQVVVKRKILATSTVLLHLTLWGLLGGLLAVVVKFIKQ